MRSMSPEMVGKALHQLLGFCEQKALDSRLATQSRRCTDSEAVRKRVGWGGLHVWCLVFQDELEQLPRRRAAPTQGPKATNKPGL